MRLSKIAHYKRIDSTGTSRPTDGTSSMPSKPSKSSKVSKPTKTSASSKVVKASPTSPPSSPFPSFASFSSRGPPPPRFLVAGGDLTSTAHVFVEDKPTLDEVAALVRLMAGGRSSHPLAIRALLAYARSRPEDFVVFLRSGG